MNLQQVVEDGVPERVRLRANEVVFVPKSWIGNMNEVVDLYVRGLIPALPRVGVGYSLSNAVAATRRTSMATLQTLPDATTVLPANGGRGEPAGDP